MELWLVFIQIIDFSFLDKARLGTCFLSFAILAANNAQNYIYEQTRQKMQNF